MQEYGAQRRGNAGFIWAWGATSGLIIGLVQGILALFSLGSLSTILDVVVWLVGFFIVGMLAARETGRVGTSSLVGLVAGLVGGIIALIVAIILLNIRSSEVTAAVNQAVQNAQAKGQNVSPGEIQTIATIGIIVGLVFSVLLEIGLGAGIGALGGLAGRRRALPPDVNRQQQY